MFVRAFPLFVFTYTFCEELQKPFGSYLLPNFHNRRKPVQDKDSSCFLIKVVHRIQSNSNSQKAFNFPKSGPSSSCLVKKILDYISLNLIDSRNLFQYYKTLLKRRTKPNPQTVSPLFHLFLSLIRFSLPLVSLLESN